METLEDQNHHRQQQQGTFFVSALLPNVALDECRCSNEDTKLCVTVQLESLPVNFLDEVSFLFLKAEKVDVLGITLSKLIVNINF